MQFGSSNDLYRKSGFGLHQLRNCFSRLAANIRPPASQRQSSSGHVRKRVHAGLPTEVYRPVKVNSPVFRSTRKDAMLSLR